MRYLQFMRILTAIGILGWFAVCDLKKNTLPGNGLPVCIPVTLGIRALLVLTGTEDLWNSLTAVLPAIFLLLLSWGTGEKIGYGDGLTLLILGNLLTGAQVWKILAGAICLTFPISVILLITGKATGATRLPFVPFLFLAACGIYAVGFFL